MKRKVLSLIVLAILMTTLCGCGCSKSSSATTKQENMIATTAPTSATTIPTPEPTIATPEPIPEPTPSIEVEWQTLTYQWEDSSGYTFEATVKVSPWINTKDTDYVAAAWDEVSRGKALPASNPDSWGLSHYSNGTYGRSNDEYGSFRPVKNITDIYYCIGSVTIKNLTAGWDITASTPITSDALWLSACQPETDVKEVQQHPSLQDNYTRSSTLSRIFFSNGEKTNPTWARFSPQYTSNKWGPVAFVFAHFDNKTPASPNGEYISEIADTYFCVNGRDFFVWIKEMSELATLKLNIVE